MKYRLAAILITLVFNSPAQVNLVPNPSFEDYSTCPFNTGQIDFATGWFSANAGSPDLFNICSTSTEVQVPVNWAGNQLPYFGNGYAGLALYGENGYREYIEIKLNEALISNKIYCIEFYISLSDNQNLASNNIGVIFSSDSIFVNNDQLIELTNPLVNNEVETNQIGWEKIQFSYVATGGEKYLVIGNFNANNSTSLYVVGTPYYPDAYYYIDDVSVYECNKEDIDIIILPNIFTPNGDGINDIFEIEFLSANSKLSVYNRWGNQVYQSDNYQNNWDGENHSDGVYYYILTVPSGNTKKGTVTLLRD